MSRKKHAPLDPLTKTEEEIMQHIWDLKRCTVSDILEKLGRPTPPHSTISSIVRILERKGYVDHKAYGRTYEYFPLVSKEGIVKKRLSGLLAQYFDGSPRALVNFLVREQDLDAADLKKLLDQLNKKD